METKPMTHPLIRRRFMALLGVDQDYTPGEIIRIRGQDYVFKSFTEVYDAARGNLGEYNYGNQNSK